MVPNKLFCNIIVIIIVVFICTYSVCAKEKTIESIKVKDNKLLVHAKGVSDATKFDITINGERVNIVQGSVTVSLENSSFEVELPQNVKPENAEVSITYDGQPIDTPDLLYKPERQPEILSLDPVGGIEGTDISIFGKNFENTPKKDIQIKIETGVGEKAIIFNPDSISLVENDTDKKEQIRFSIPSGEDLVRGHWLSNNVKLRVLVDGNLSKSLDLTIVDSNWKRKAALLSVLLVLVLFIFLAISTKKFNFMKDVLLEKKSNTYSLSKFQAFSWTIIFIGSYFYLAIGKGLILGKGVIPEFNPTLLGMMGISYGGLLVSNKVSNTFPKKDLEGAPLRLSNLISEGGQISIPRIQLVGFTITGILIYLYNLYDAELFLKGLPDIPPTLLGLMGMSQGGYISGKAIGGKLAVNYVVPRKIQIMKGAKLIVSGSGFVDNMKALLQDIPDSLKAEYLDSKTMFQLNVPPDKFKNPGWKQLILHDPIGSSILVEAFIEVVNPKIEIVSFPNKQVRLKLKGFDFHSISATINDNLVDIKKVNETTMMIEIEVYREMFPNKEIKITITSEDGHLQADVYFPRIKSVKIISEKKVELKAIGFDLHNINATINDNQAEITNVIKSAKMIEIEASENIKTKDKVSIISMDGLLVAETSIPDTGGNDPSDTGGNDPSSIGL